MGVSAEPIKPPSGAACLTLREHLAEMFVLRWPEWRWSFVALLGLAIAVGTLPVVFGRHLSLTIPVLVLVGFTKLCAPPSGGLVILAVSTASRLLIDLFDHDVFWATEVPNLVLDFAAGLALVLLIRYIADRERVRVALSQAAALDESEGRMRLLARWANIGLWDWVTGDDHAYFSPVWKAQLGYDDCEVPNLFSEWIERIHPEDAERVSRHLADYLAGRSPAYSIEFRMRHRDGSWRWIHSQGNAFRDADGRPIRSLGCHIDITARKQSEHAIAAQGRELREVQRIAQIGRFSCDLASRAWEGSEELAAIMGLSTLRGNDYADMLALVHPDDRLRVRQYVKQAIEGNHGIDCSFRIIRVCDRSVRWLHSRGHLARSPHGASTRMIGFVQDITHHHEMTAAMDQAVQRMRLAERAADRASRAERERVGRQLHDGLAQQLAAANIETSVLSRRMVQHRCQFADDMEGLATRIRAMVVMCRRIAQGMLSEVVPGNGLPGRLSDLARQTSQGANQLACTFALVGAAPRLTEEQATHLYLVACEALRNVAAHAGATEAAVTLECDGVSARLTVCDNGRGLGEDRVRPDAMGRQIMAHRAALLGGAYSIGAGPKGGTCVTCEIPLSS